MTSHISIQNDSETALFIKSQLWTILLFLGAVVHYSATSGGQLHFWGQSPHQGHQQAEP